MKKKLLQIWRGRLRLSRGWRITRNLVLTLACLYVLWARAGYPLSTAEMEFRRLERTHLMPPSEIVFSNGERSREGLRVSRQDGSVFALDGTELYLRGRWMAGVRGDRAAVACLSENWQYIRSFPLGAGPTLVPLLERGRYLDHAGYWVTHGPGETPEGDPAYVYNYHNFAPFLLLNAPEGTVGVEIAIQLEGEEYSGGGWQLENGVWMLGVEQEWRLGDGPVGDTAYILRLFRADGSLLLEKCGMLGEG